jgi:hypothetical protein
MKGIIVIMCAVMAVMVFVVGVIAVLCISLKAENDDLRRLIGGKGCIGRDAEETEDDFRYNSKR